MHAGRSIIYVYLMRQRKGANSGEPVTARLFLTLFLKLPCDDPEELLAS